MDSVFLFSESKYIKIWLNWVHQGHPGGEKQIGELSNLSERLKMSENHVQAFGIWSLTEYLLTQNSDKNVNKSTEMLSNSSEVLISAVVNKKNSTNSVDDSIHDKPLIFSKLNNLQNFSVASTGLQMPLGRDSLDLNLLSECSGTQKRYRKSSEIARILKEFNGQNISVNQFIRDVKNVERFAHPIDKDFFIELVKSKVVGDAQAYLQYKTFANLD